MKPSNVGQVVKFHSPLADEDPNQLYVILEIKGNDDTSRVDIKALNDGHHLTSIMTVKLKDLAVVELPTFELIGHNVSIVGKNKKVMTGKVIQANEGMIDLRLTKLETGIETNVEIGIEDREGAYHQGFLFIN